MLNNEIISKLEGMGFKRWQRYNYDRLYIAPTKMGLEYTTYNTGNISSAWFNGEKISNRQAYKLRDKKTYIDVVTGKVVGESSDFKAIATQMLADAMA